MVCHGIGNKCQIQFLRDLFHDRCFSDSRSTDQKHRSLLGNGDPELSVLVSGAVGDYRILDLFFCLFDIHQSPPLIVSSSILYLIAHGGTVMSLFPSRNTNAVRKSGCFFG